MDKNIISDADASYYPYIAHQKINWQLHKINLASEIQEYSRIRYPNNSLQCQETNLELVAQQSSPGTPSKSDVENLYIAATVDESEIRKSSTSNYPESEVDVILETRGSSTCSCPESDEDYSHIQKPKVGLVTLQPYITNCSKADDNLQTENTNLQPETEKSSTNTCLGSEEYLQSHKPNLTSEFRSSSTSSCPESDEDYFHIQKSKLELETQLPNLTICSKSEENLQSQKTNLQIETEKSSINTCSGSEEYLETDKTLKSDSEQSSKSSCPETDSQIIKTNIELDIQQSISSKCSKPKDNSQVPKTNIELDTPQSISRREYNLQIHKTNIELDTQQSISRKCSKSKENLQIQKTNIELEIIDTQQPSRSKCSKSKKLQTQKPIIDLDNQQLSTSKRSQSKNNVQTQKASNDLDNQQPSTSNRSQSKNNAQTQKASNDLDHQQPSTSKRSKSKNNVQTQKPSNDLDNQQPSTSKRSKFKYNLQIQKTNSDSEASSSTCSASEEDNSMVSETACKSGKRKKTNRNRELKEVISKANKANIGLGPPPGIIVFPRASTESSILDKQQLRSFLPIKEGTLKARKEIPGPSEEDRNAYKKYMFYEEYDDEFDAFRKYFDFIRENGLYDKIVNDIENMGDVCDLFEEVMTTYKDQKLNLTCIQHEKSKNSSSSRAVDFVKLKRCSEKGKYLQAAKDILADETLIKEKPVIFQVSPICKCIADSYDSLYKCHHCGLTVEDFYPCLDCNICVFCSKMCLEDAQREYHDYECYGFQRHFWSIFDSTDFSYLSLRMVLYGAKQKFNYKEKKNNLRLEKNNYSFIYALETHFDKMSKDQINKILYNSARNILYLKNKSHFFPNNRWLSKQIRQKDFFSYVGGLMVRHHCQAQINSINITFPNLLVVNGIQTSSGYGKAICPTISLINHSCKPNSTIMVFSDGVAVRSLVPIKRQEEITVCYCEINTFMSLEERRLIADHFFFFTCKCSLCESEMNAMEDQYKCPVCQKCNVTNIENVNGKVTAQCAKCGKRVSMTSSMKQLELAIKYRESYERTNDVDHLIKMFRCYRALVLQNSIHMLDICQVLYKRYRHEVDNIEAIRYGLLMFEILEDNIPKLHFPLLSAKFSFLMNFRTIKLPSRMTEEELSIIKEYVNVALRIKQDIIFYLPIENISDYTLLLREVGRMMIQFRNQWKGDR